MRKPMTDLELLRKIHKDYYQSFENFRKNQKVRTRETVIYVPIDIKKIASDIDVDPNLIFCRLYYVLNKQYGYTQPDNTKVLLYTPVLGKDRDCINFPMLDSILANMEKEEERFSLSTKISIAALLISLISIILQKF